jgi:small basic protein (TIGR04137 family)
LKNFRPALQWPLVCFVTLQPFNGLTFQPSMSQHRSLKGASTIAAKRNVLKRFERVDLLKKRSQWKDGQKVIGLPKTKPDV